jgi:hypothetical protein
MEVLSVKRFAFSDSALKNHFWKKTRKYNMRPTDNGTIQPLYHPVFPSPLCFVKVLIRLPNAGIRTGLTEIMIAHAKAHGNMEYVVVI